VRFLGRAHQHRVGRRSVGLDRAERCLILRVTFDLDRPVTPHWPDGPQHHLGSLQVALHRMLQDHTNQLLAGRHAETIEVANRGAHGIAQRTGPAGIACDEAAVGVAVA